MKISILLFLLLIYSSLIQALTQEDLDEIKIQFLGMCNYVVESEEFRDHFLDIDRDNNKIATDIMFSYIRENYSKNDGDSLLKMFANSGDEDRMNRGVFREKIPEIKTKCRQIWDNSIKKGF